MLETIDDSNSRTQKTEEDVLLGGAKTMKKAAYGHEIAPKDWVMSNHAAFLDWMNKTFAYEPDKQPDSDACSLFDHQRFIKDYLQSQSPYRGALLYHGLGVGKSRASIAVAESLRPHVKRVIGMFPASLRQNYINEVIDCGHREFAKAQYWKAVKVDIRDADDLQSTADMYGVSIAHLKRFGRVWKVSKKRTREDGSNWEALKENWPEIMTFITALVMRKYDFINYNGLRHSNVAALPKNYFDDSVVIIDEAHNFISRVVNGAIVDGKIVGNKVLMPMYQMLMDAKNLKIVMLSGTPLINRPIELAYTLNLIRGYIQIYDLYYRSTRAFSLDSIQSFLDTHPVIDMAQIDAVHKRIRVALVPDGFSIDADRKFISQVGKTSEADRSVYGVDAATRLEAIKDQLKDMGAEVGSVLPRQFTALPLDEDKFDELFINYGTKKPEDAIRNPGLFARRIVGLVSYFEAYKPEHYPHLEDTEIVEVPFSEGHFDKYMEMRGEEAERETKNKNSQRMQKKRGNANASKDQLTQNSTYRSFSRALCNFCFPEEIGRKFPRDIRALLKEQDNGDADASFMDIAEDGDAEGKHGAKNSGLTGQAQYDASIGKALGKLRKHGEEYLKGKALLNYGPKYYEIMRRLKKSPGSALVYSQFRTVEGAAIMRLVLEAHGYAELRAVRREDGGGSDELTVTWDEGYTYSPQTPFFVTFVGSAKEETQLLMDIFNSNWGAVPPAVIKKLKAAGVDVSNKVRNLYGAAVKVMIITQSGSEGISLRNVRQVHILEPYWNEIRLKQVIGRAVRAKSHVELPVADRNVKVYQYMAVFTPRQLEIPDVDSREGRKTSDEFIQDIAARKGFINNSLLHILKNTAIDCRINLSTHMQTQPNQSSKRPIQCFQLPEGYQRLSFVYGDVEDDETDAHTAQRGTTEQVASEQVFVTIYVDTESTGNREEYQAFPYDKNNNFIYDKTDFDAGRLRIIGRIHHDTNSVVFN